MDLDLKLVAGRVLDGSGNAAQRLDVGVCAGKIVAVGDLSTVGARKVIDCSGKTVVPGFIDIHSHADWLLSDPGHGELCEPFVRQGITTVVGGNCGFSPAPVTEVNRPDVHEASRLIVDRPIEIRWRSAGEFLDTLEREGIALNLAELVGHGAVRAAVTGLLNPGVPNREELAQMERLTREALEAGCIGVSTGLGYPPGIFADEPELVEFARWAGQAGKILTSHLKAYSWVSGSYTIDPNQEPHNLVAIREAVRAAAAADVRLQISHFIFVGRRTWPNYEEGLRLVEDARAAGVDVAFDAFPYTAGNTTASILFPSTVLPALEEVLENAGERKALKEFAQVALSTLGLDLGDIQIMNYNAPRFEEYNGLRVTEAAARAGMEPFDFYCRMVLESRRSARVLIHTYSGDERTEEVLKAVLRHPLCTMETDAFVTREGHQNPAAYGAFPRVLSRCVRQGLFGLEEALHRVTGAVAERLGWRDRGWVRKGCAADLVVLDVDRLQDTATFDNPASFPLGIEHVFVNGRHVLAGDFYDAAAKAGQVIRA